MTAISLYFGLFVVAFLAATIFPAQSEAMLTGLLLHGDYQPWMLVLVASIGNTLGAVVNWGLGRGIESFRDRRWFPATAGQLERAKAWYGRFGRWSLLLSWLPFIGDPLTVAAGIMRERFSVFVLLVGAAKSARYAILALTTLTFAGN